MPGGSTRLVTRMKQDYRWTTPRLAPFNVVLMEFGDFAMEHRMLNGIKRRAEAARHEPEIGGVEVRGGPSRTPLDLSQRRVEASLVAQGETSPGRAPSGSPGRMRRSAAGIAPDRAVLGWPLR